MAANQNVAQSPRFRKPDNPGPGPVEISSINPSPLIPRQGVVTLYGYGTSVRVDRGHLVVEDGIGPDRFRSRFPRVGHGLRRLVAIGSDGCVSLSALRWLADQGASFVMLERDGTVLATTGPVRPSDVRVRRAQALAHHTGAALRISRELIDRKLAGQEKVARELLKKDRAAVEIKKLRSELAEVDSMGDIRYVESRGAKTYWEAWRAISIRFPEQDLPRIPGHWRTFGSRVSPLTGNSRLAANPVNAILNYLYAVLEAECRLALAALGLDPEMGFLHMDCPNRDSLACDLMEPVRPDVDAYVLNWILQKPLSRKWFFEEHNGNCRLMASLARQLAETAPLWGRLAAPLAEWVLKEIAATTKGKSAAPTRLTQNRKREVKGAMPLPPPKCAVRVRKLCKKCGMEIRDHNAKCRKCATEDWTDTLKKAATLKGRKAAHSPDAEAKRAETQRVNRDAQLKWSSTNLPSWLTEAYYVETIQPLLSRFSGYSIARQVGVSRAYAAEIRNGRVPHPRHWLSLAILAGIPRISSTELH